MHCTTKFCMTLYVWSVTDSIRCIYMCKIPADRLHSHRDLKHTRLLWFHSWCHCIVVGRNRSSHHHHRWYSCLHSGRVPLVHREGLGIKISCSANNNVKLSSSAGWAWYVWHCVLICVVFKPAVYVFLSHAVDSFAIIWYWGGRGYCYSNSLCYQELCNMYTSYRNDEWTRHNIPCQ
jgi:hypothetical protein